MTVKSIVVTLPVTPVKSTAERRKELLLDAIKKAETAKKAIDDKETTLQKKFKS